jgi:hypothetical protein
LNISEILPKGWEHIDTYREDTNGDSKREWIILYQFDLPERKTSGSPIGAAIYQLDGKSPPNITAYDLRPPDHDYLCECTCDLDINNVLSGLDGNELVIRDNCGEQTSRLTIFRWDLDKKTYTSPGHFTSDHIGIGRDVVTTTERLPGRAQLVMVKTYYPDDNTTYYRRDDQCSPLECEKKELDFYHGEPEDVCCSPYPEKVVLAFYKHYNDDEKAPIYLSERAQEHFGQCDAGECGCTAPRHEIDRVRVLELDPDLDDTQDPDRATVGAWIVCEPRSGVSEARKYVKWRLIREDDRWQLDGPAQ